MKLPADFHGPSNRARCARNRAIVIVERRQLGVGRRHAIEQCRPRSAAQEPFEPRTERFIAHPRESVQLVEQFLHRLEDGLALAGLKVGQRIGRRAIDRPPGRSYRPDHTLAQTAIEPVDLARPATTAEIPPMANLIDDQWGRQTGPVDARHFGGGECDHCRGELAAGPSQPRQVARRAALGVEHTPNRAANVRILIASKCSRPVRCAAEDASPGGVRPCGPTLWNASRNSPAARRS